jgi:hypothetical protein
VKQCLCLQVLFCSTEVGRTSFVRQLEADFHIDTSLEVVSQLSVCDLVSLFFFGGGFALMFKFLNSAVFFLCYQRFIRCQLFISSMEGGQLAANVFNSPSLEQFFSLRQEFLNK